MLVIFMGDLSVKLPVWLGSRTLKIGSVQHVSE